LKANIENHVSIETKRFQTMGFNLQGLNPTRMVMVNRSPHTVAQGRSLQFKAMFESGLSCFSFKR